MTIAPYRAQNLALGLNLGWLQQGAVYGGRPIVEMTADLENIRHYAASAGYHGYAGYVDAALAKLQAGQPPAAIISEINTLAGLFQGQAQGQSAAALNLGINLGWLQQGARANNRPVSMAIADLGRVSLYAQQAGYHGYASYVQPTLGKLTSGQPVSATLGDITALIGLLQGEG